MVWQGQHKQGAAPLGLPIEGQRAHVVQRRGRNGAARGDAACVCIEHGIAGSVEQRRTQRPGIGARRLQCSANSGERDGAGGIDRPRLAVVELDLEAGVGLGLRSGCAVEPSDGVHRSNARGQTGIVHGHVWLAADQIAVHARSPTHADVEWAVPRHLLGRHPFHSPKAEVLRECGEDEILVDRLSGKAKLQRTALHLNEVRQRVDRVATPTKGDVLPPSIGRQGRTVIGPQASRRRTVVLSRKRRGRSGQWSSTKEVRLGKSVAGAEQQHTAEDEEEAHMVLSKYAVHPSRVSAGP